jgi:hypothetical protein
VTNSEQSTVADQAAGCAGIDADADRATKEGRMKKHDSNTVFVGHDGPPCSRCQQPTEIREHAQITAQATVAARTIGSTA